MKNKDDVLWIFPFSFFIFIASFIFVKFIFIFFFNAAFSPRFIFELTPLYLIGMNDLQLLMVSSLVVMIDAYLHIKDTRKNLISSFVPTSIIIAGIGSIIATREISAVNLIYYAVFGITLLTILVDHTQILRMSGPVPAKEKKEIKSYVKKTPLLTRIGRTFTPLKSVKLWKKPVVSPLPKDSYTMTSGFEPVKPVTDTLQITTPKATPILSDKKESNIEEDIDKIINNRQIETAHEDKTDSKKIYETEKSFGLESIEILDSEYIDILAKIDIKTVDDLAKCNPKDLVKTIDDHILKNIVDYLETADKKGYIDVTENMTEAWINAAKNLTK
ncbi:hypothetical protein MBGDN05_00284 [Thermoplasmatales archaeon SCGC AB-539-N05]|nr:hypothetical protein MBGDN05_00284 [Thermoplasmatales archaeon SCGC AB-539-N05]